MNKLIDPFDKILLIFHRGWVWDLYLIFSKQECIIKDDKEVGGSTLSFHNK